MFKAVHHVCTAFILRDDFMKKSKKTSIIAIVFVVAAILFLSTSFYSAYQDMQAQISEWQDTTWFVFTNDFDSLENAEYLTIEEIQKFESATDIYNQGVYYETLNAQEKLIYKAYQYALDNNYIYTDVDGELLEGCNNSALDIIVFLSLDSGIVQQNLSTVEYTSSYTMYNRFYWQEVSKEFEGYLVSAETFSEERIAKVDKAIKKLEKIEFNFDENTTEKEKAWEIFKYVEDNVNYFPEEKASKLNNKSGQKLEEVEDFLYSAVFEGETNCDGFANMYSLLCQMNGLKCFEKVSSSQDEKIAGHTWNAVSIDGKWYNVDCTEAIYTDEDEKTIEIYELLNFGYSDELQSDKLDYANITPKCNDNILPVVKQYSSPEASGVAREIANAIRESDEDSAVVVFKSFDEEDFRRVGRNIADNLYSSIYYVMDERESATICYIYR